MVVSIGARIRFFLMIVESDVGRNCPRSATVALAGDWQIDLIRGLCGKGDQYYHNRDYFKAKSPTS
jgi:hypothetical protein